MRKCGIGFLCFCLFWTTVAPAYAQTPLVSDPLGEAQILRDYPNAKIVRVSPQEYPALEAELSRRGYRAGDQLLLAARGYEALEAERTVSSDLAGGSSARSYRDDECGDADSRRRDDGDAVHVVLDQLDGSNNRDAMVVFVIIGAVVVVFWSIYAFKFAYDVAVGKSMCGRWSDLGLSRSVAASGMSEHARFTGVRLLSGFRQDNTDFGLGGEVGLSDIRLTEAESLDLKGQYWLLGPVLRWRIGRSTNPDYIQMEFLAGSTTNRETGLLAQARIGMNFGYPNGMRWGFNFGAMNLNLKSNQGIISDRSKYYYLLGLETGFRF